MASVSWRTHPLREHRRRGAAGLAVVAAAVALVQAAAGSPALTAAAAVLLLAQVRSFYLPITYRIDGEGVVVDEGLWRRRRRWGEFRCWEPLPGAVLLSPCVRPCWRERWRGLVLPCPGQEVRVATALAAHLPRRPAEAAA